MKNIRPDFIKHCDELVVNESFSYPGDSETFGTGAALGRKLGLKRIGINYEILQPGDRSSWPHAHKEDEEFIFILEGHPQMWIDGNIYDLNPGDCVGLPPNTGHAHTLLNNSDKVVKAIVIGDSEIPTDKIFYPKHPKRNEECKEKGFFWDGHPENKIGNHDGWTDLKRPK
ncbi:MAG: cupin domain-containing protein [Bacteriovorax sp.]|nr:cupin domain-containing protein [Bacteriovorax sp.]